MPENKISKNELKIRLKELEEEYRLARNGLIGGFIIILFSIVAVSGTIFVTSIEFKGQHVVMIVGILAAAIIVYFSFVFRRVAKIRLEISRTKAQLDMASGEKA